MSYSEKLQSIVDCLDGFNDTALKGDHSLNSDEGFRSLQESRLAAGDLKSAAVLVGLLDRPGGVTLLLTQRAANLARHAGQVAFPGGRAEESDASSLDTALRETHEEVGIERQFITPIGQLADYATGTGYIVSPHVGIVSNDAALHIDPGEVAEAFEVPLAHFLLAENYKTQQREWKGRDVTYYVLHCEDTQGQMRQVWGATAGMLSSLCDRYKSYLAV